MAETVQDGSSSANPSDREERIRRIAERVWQLWREELRRDQERRGQTTRGR